MAYFDGIKVGDKVWDFNYGYGEVIEVSSKYNYIKVKFNDPLKMIASYYFNGHPRNSTIKKQTLFWDKVNFEIPRKQDKKGDNKKN